MELLTGYMRETYDLLDHAEDKNVAQGRKQHLCLNQVQQIDHMLPKIKFKNCFVIPLISNPRIISTIYVV